MSDGVIHERTIFCQSLNVWSFRRCSCGNDYLYVLQSAGSIIEFSIYCILNLYFINCISCISVCVDLPRDRRRKWAHISSHLIKCFNRMFLCTSHLSELGVKKGESFLCTNQDGEIFASKMCWQLCCCLLTVPSHSQSKCDQPTPTRSWWVYD